MICGVGARLRGSISDYGARMNKSQLVDAVAARIGDRRVAAGAVGAVLDAIVRTVAAGESVVLRGFGTFEGRARSARTARDPRTGAVVAVAARTVPAFQPGTTFRATVAAAAAARATAEAAARAAEIEAAEAAAQAKALREAGAFVAGGSGSAPDRERKKAKGRRKDRSKVERRDEVVARVPKRKKPGKKGERDAARA